MKCVWGTFGSPLDDRLESQTLKEKKDWKRTSIVAKIQVTELSAKKRLEENRPLLGEEENGLNAFLLSWLCKFQIKCNEFFHRETLELSSQRTPMNSSMNHRE